MKKSLLLILVIVFTCSNVFAYVGYRGRTRKPMARKKSVEIAKPKVALEGACAVCVYSGKMMKGNDNFVTMYKGKLYKFPGMKQQKAFLNNPEKYVAGIEGKYKKLKKKGSKREKSGMYEGSGTY